MFHVHEVHALKQTNLIEFARSDLFTDREWAADERIIILLDSKVYFAKF